MINKTHKFTPFQMDPTVDFEYPLKYVGYGEVVFDGLSSCPIIYKGYEASGVFKIWCKENILAIKQLNNFKSHGIKVIFI